MSLPRCRKTKATIRYDLVADELENILRIEIGRYGIEKHRPIAGTGSSRPFAVGRGGWIIWVL